MPELQQDVEEAARKQLDELTRRRRCAAAADPAGDDHRRSPAAAIVDYAATEHIDLIVIGTHGRGAVAIC